MIVKMRIQTRQLWVQGQAIRVGGDGGQQRERSHAGEQAEDHCQDQNSLCLRSLLSGQ